MTTWREARAARVERQRRERRHYTPDKLGKPCPACGIKVPKGLGPYHPTCGPDVADVMRRAARS